MTAFVELLKTRIFCKQCTLTMWLHFKFGILKALHTDTISIEIFQGLFAVGLGLLLFSPDTIDFGKGLGVILWRHYITQRNLAIIFTSVGILKICGATFGSVNFRKYLALILLYVWLCILYYVVHFDAALSGEAVVYIMLCLSSIFTYLSLWRYRWM